MNQPQSDTPRTDNFRQQGREWLPLGIFEDTERELTAAQDTIKRLAIDHMATLGELAEALQRVKDVEYDLAAARADLEAARDQIDALKAAPPASEPQYLDRPDGPGWWWDFGPLTGQWYLLDVLAVDLYSSGIWSRATPPPAPKEEGE
jgi:hypothetical protein